MNPVDEDEPYLNLESNHERLFFVHFYRLSLADICGGTLARLTSEEGEDMENS